MKGVKRVKAAIKNRLNSTKINPKPIRIKASGRATFITSAT